MDLEEMNDITQTSNKIQNISRKTGLREGITAGRDSNFQKSFDRGFEEGFKNGFLLGKYKGTLSAKSKQTSTEEKLHPLLEHASRGSCDICKNSESIPNKEDIDTLIDTQKKSFKNTVQILNLEFKEGISDDQI
ncbi:unnamed protein product [Psylliodes chrysocephalus]|uniref:Essential protein Yae1 N-terminal domain-containing protein n=1 Tax=Psylliodes chrysocephalus TaxID=3402493 RepID=A0A9P0GAS6_9CUCU|nr:unnamed protein product [Psylliodes chrysocephala]